MISDIKVWPLKKNHETIKANVQFVVDNAWKVKGTLMAGKEGLFVGLPGKYAQEFDPKQNKFVDKIDPKTGKKIWYPDVACINKETQKELNEVVIAEYNKAKGNTGLDQGPSPEGPTDQTKQNIPFG